MTFRSFNQGGSERKRHGQVAGQGNPAGRFVLCCPVFQPAR